MVGAFQWRRKLAELQVSGQGTSTLVPESDALDSLQRATHADISTSHGS
jgi:hypothetical protein